MDSVILPIMTYGAQKWSLTKENERKIQTEQMAMTRKVLRINKLQHKTNDEVRQRIFFIDALYHAKCLKWDFCGHTQRLTDGRWTKTVENWQPTDGNRNKGRQKKRWRDEIEKIGLGRWRIKAKDRKI